jgi:hypothetical protein
MGKKKGNFMRLLLTCLITLGSAAPVLAQGSNDPLKLKINYPFYEIGEGVGFSFTNNSGGTIEFGVAPWRIDKGTTTVYQSFFLFFFQTMAMPNGQTRYWKWYQGDQGKTQVPPGLYKIVVFGTQANGQPFERTVPFEIFPKTAGTVVANTTKSSYSSWESVRFYVINKSWFGKSLPSGNPWKIQHGNSVVYTPASLPGTVYLGSGARKIWTWNKTNSFGNLVPSGFYKVVLKVNTGGFWSGPTTFSLPFSITN